MGADLQGLEEEGSQPPLFGTRVTWTLPVYNHQTIQDHHRAVNQEFGLPYLADGRRTDRRYTRSVGAVGSEINSYNLDYYFRDPHDAILFSLKYSR
jgi:hypothetical protein